MQTAASKIWNQVEEFISYDDNRYITTSSYQM